MQFSETEIQFLIRPHKMETAHFGSRALSAAQDLRTLGCPKEIFNRVLEDRARKLGSKFTEFRSQQVEQSLNTPTTNLESALNSERLF